MVRILTLLALLAAAAPAGAETVRAEVFAFGRAGWIEARGLPAPEAESAIRQAVLRLRWSERELEGGPAGEGSLAGLNAAAGDGPRGVEREIAALLDRARNFCLWLDGLHGPLGARLYELWGEGEERARPGRDALEAATEGAGCDRMIVDAAAGTVEVAAGSRLRLVGFDVGFGIDQAVEALREAGIESGRVAVGGVQRAFGRVEGGLGWPTPLPRFPGMREPLGSVRLEDEALAMVQRHAAGERLLDQRTGLPADGPLAVLAVTELAVDAQALATAMFIAGSRDGQMRLGGLRPQPAVLWLLGDGTGEPVFTSHRWTRVTR